MFQNYAFKAEAGKVFSALAARMGLFVAVMLFAGFVYAQQPPLTFVYEPDAWDIGDTISIEFVYGSAQNPASPANEFHLIHEYSGLEYVIDQESVFTVDTTASWICGDCTIDIWVDHELQKIHVWISRDDEEEVSGYGTVLILRGIITIIDEIHRRPNPQNPSHSSSLVTVTNQKLLISRQEQSPCEIIIADMGSGRQVFHSTYKSRDIKIDLSTFPAGIYFLTTQENNRISTRKFALR